MAEFTLSGFADEIDPMLRVQMEELNKLKIGYIELRGVDGRNISDYTPAEAKELKTRLDGHGIRVSAIGSPIGKIQITDPMEPHLAQFRTLLETAKVLEAPYIRLFSFFIPKGQPAADFRDEVLRRMNQFVNAAKGSGVMLLHENEKDIYGDTADRCLDIIESVGSDNLRVTFDPANFVQVGEETYPRAWQMLSPYVEYMHIKDALPDGSVVPAGHGAGHLKELLTALVEADYKGFLSLEPHLGNFQGFASLELDDSLAQLPDGGPKTFGVAADALRKLLKEVEG